MNITELKTEITTLIEQESDLEVLLQIKQLLNQHRFKSMMNDRAVKAEADIIAGRIYSLDETRKTFRLN